MKINEAIHKAAEQLQGDAIENPRWEARILLAFVLQKDIAYTYAYPEHSLSNEAVGRYESIVKKRSGGMPFQYISQSQPFMSLDFYVNENCLIPRPETELLVESALRWMKGNRRERVRVLDIGTGSGAIAVSIAYYAKDSRVAALDISNEAIKIAHYNAKRHCVDKRIRFLPMDFLCEEPDDTYTVVLSNPPYIPRREIDGLMPGVRDYEPEIALNGGEDGLVFYRLMACRMERLLEPGGVVFVEVGAGQADPVCGLFQKQGFVTRVYPDLAGIQRVVRADRR